LLVVVVVGIVIAAAAAAAAAAPPGPAGTAGTAGTADPCGGIRTAVDCKDECVWKETGSGPGSCERMQVAYDRRCIMATKAEECGNTGRATPFEPHYTQGGQAICTWSRSGAGAMACAVATCGFRGTPRACMLGSAESPCRWVVGRGCIRDATFSKDRLRAQQAANARPRQSPAPCRASPLRDVCHRSWMTVRDATFRPHRACADFRSVDECPTAKGCSTVCAGGGACCDCGDQIDCSHDKMDTAWSRSLELTGGEGGAVVVDPRTAPAVRPPQEHALALYADACCEPMDAGTCYSEAARDKCDARPKCGYDAAKTPPCQPRPCAEIREEVACRGEERRCQWYRGEGEAGASCHAKERFNAMHLTPDRCAAKASAAACVDAQGCETQTAASGEFRACATLAHAGFGVWRGTGVGGTEGTATLFVQRYPETTYATIRVDGNALLQGGGATVELRPAGSELRGAGRAFPTDAAAASAAAASAAAKEVDLRILPVLGAGVGAGGDLDVVAVRAVVTVDGAQSQRLTFRLVAATECAAEGQGGCIPTVSQSSLRSTHRNSLVLSQWSLPIAPSP
jgi:uncharacterized protein YodC (DUF2158 family)